MRVGLAEALRQRSLRQAGFLTALTQNVGDDIELFAQGAGLGSGHENYRVQARGVTGAEPSTNASARRARRARLASWRSRVMRKKLMAAMAVR